MKAILYGRGTLLILHVSGQPPGRPVHVADGESVDERIDLICAEKNAGSVGTAPIGRDDFLIIPIFSKDSCGPIDLSVEGVEAVAATDWDTTFARQCQAQLNAADADKIANDPAAAG